MKKIPIFLLFLTGLVCASQDKIFVHTATVANTIDHITYMDHPDLNANPDAVFITNHVWNPTNSGVYNNNAEGVFYTGYEWAIFNENLNPMIAGTSFNIYIPSNPDALFSHYAFLGNQGSQPNTTVIDHPDFNGENPGPIAVSNNIIVYGGIYNTKPYSFYFDTTLDKRGVYINDLSVMEEGYQFKILNFNETAGAVGYRHETVSTNISNNITYIDHPDLNGKPNARFVFSQYWGINGPLSQVEIASQVGSRYDAAESKWSIYLEDELLDMPERAVFDVIIIPETPLGTLENGSGFKTILYPNPAQENLTIAAAKNIETITIYNMLGQKVEKIDGGQHILEINISRLKSGLYFVKVNAQGAAQMFQFIKE